MRVVIVVSKDIGYEMIDRAIRDSGFKVSEAVFFGTSAVEEWAKKNDIPVRIFVADRPI